MDRARMRLGRRELERSADWVAGHQRRDGGIPWFPGGKLDPWDHVQCAMGLASMGRLEEARRAYRFLAETQDRDGTWPSAATATEVLDATRDSNHAAYVATGLWHYYRASGDVAFLRTLWPVLERAVGFVLRLQDESGVVAWAADPNGVVWPAPLVAGCSSIHGSLLCAVRIAGVLGYERPEWERARRRLARAMRERYELFLEAPVPAPPGQFSMDWYYPVLGGILRGEAGRRRLFAGKDVYLDEGAGCRCVVERPWYTVAETCELVLALDACGLGDRGLDLFSWVHTLREGDGGYWTGIAYPEMLLWPVERPSWTTATVLLAADALFGEGPTSGFFRELGAEDQPPRKRASFRDLDLRLA
ncbi:MAG: prenyltransferase [Candidatus Binatia bacterium]|nr:MAG: prenyltransferase [Candidatus Binatia bacterium]